MARRRTVGLSPSAASTPGSPAGSPMAPSAATAASRQRMSGWPPAVATRSARAPRTRRSPSAQQAISTTRGSGSSSARRRASGRAERLPGPVSPGGLLAGAPTDDGRGVVQGGDNVGRLERPDPGQRPQRGRPDRTVGIGQSPAGRRPVAAVTGDDHLVTASGRAIGPGSATVRTGGWPAGPDRLAASFRGRIVRHRQEYVRDLVPTRPPSASPQPVADRAAGPGGRGGGAGRGGQPHRPELLPDHAGGRPAGRSPGEGAAGPGPRHPRTDPPHRRPRVAASPPSRTCPTSSTATPR